MRTLPTPEEQARADKQTCKRFSSPTTADKYGVKTRRGGTFYFKSREKAEFMKKHLGEIYGGAEIVEPVC